MSLALVALTWSAGAAAYCRTTTCDSSNASQACKLDTATRCNESGAPLFWASGCLTINVHRTGAPKAGISADAAQRSVQRAFDAWLSADCAGERPSLEVVVGQPVSCGVSEYSSDHHNANIVLFREDSWPYTGAEDALGITWLRFDEEQHGGELWDADIELNAVDEPLSARDPEPNEVDLDSLVTHEVGHFLGLGHTLAEDATMFAGYTAGSTELRTLTDDDIDGVCAIYPPGRQVKSTSCDARHGFSELCADEQPPFVEPGSQSPEENEAPVDRGSSCATSMSSEGAATSAPWLLLLGATALLRRRRR
jgi:MYXO-CTERM domain-containing protein